MDETPCRQPATAIDFSSVTNPAVAMEWMDAFGDLHTGSLISTSKNAALPSGSIRWKNLGTYGADGFDLLVTVSETPSYYSELIRVEYISPLGLRYQALITASGIACLGAGIRTSYCESGSVLDSTTAQCSDSTQTSMYGAEFDFQFVHNGTHEPMQAFERAFMTFYDVDGDSTNGGSIFELDAVLGARSRYIAPAAAGTLEAGVFHANEAEYAISIRNVNVQTDFNADPAYPTEASQLGVVSFELVWTSSFKVLE